LYESVLACVATDGEALSLLASPPAGSCVEELEAPRSGCVRVSLGVRGIRAALPRDRDEKRPFCCLSSDMSPLYIMMMAEEYSSSECTFRRRRMIQEQGSTRPRAYFCSDAIRGTPAFHAGTGPNGKSRLHVSGRCTSIAGIDELCVHSSRPH
jgi:hypothetical protein